MSLMLVFTTVATAMDAQQLADTLVREGLCACAQTTAIQSTYVWGGVVQQEPEYRLLLKTHESRHDALVARLQEIHPYELPAIYAIETHRVDPAFLDWVAVQSGP